MDVADELVADLLRAMPESGLKRGKVVSLIREKEVPDNPGSRRLPKGMDAEDFLEHLIHQGIFHPGTGGELSCPIPSLRSWHIQRGSENQEELYRTAGQASRRTFGSAAA